MKATIRKAKLGDLDYFLENMRAADIEEVHAYLGQAPSVVLSGSILAGDTLVGLSPEGNPGVLFGCQPIALYPGVGNVWLLATNDVLRYPVLFHKTAMRWLSDLREDYHLLLACPMSRNTVHTEWLERLSFKKISEAPSGYGNVNFSQYARITHQCV